MNKGSFLKVLFLAFSALLGSATISLAHVPPPPVNQNLGIRDSVFNTMVETDCRVCHENPNVTGDTSNVDRHHLRMGTSIPNPTDAPNGTPGGTFECLTCHTLVWNPNTSSYEFSPFRDCLLCHRQTAYQATVHHRSVKAEARDCVSCHGGLVNNFDDGHFIPTYDPDLTTPWPSRKPASGPNGEGNCSFCHDTGTGTTQPAIDPESGVLVFRNAETHHSTGFVLDSNKCTWCHDVIPPPDGLSIRRCEECHGISTLHNIQTDSPNPANLGSIVPGSEYPYYGHIGSETDCFGCHGFSSTTTTTTVTPLDTSSPAPYSGPVVPYIKSVDISVITSGTSAAVTLTGTGLTNTIDTPSGPTKLDSTAVLTTPDGSTLCLDTQSVTESQMVVDVPGTLTPGTYLLRAMKGPQSSNPVVLSVVPAVAITAAACSTDATVSIRGTGFSSHVDATESGTSVSSGTENGTILSWSDTEILAQFPKCPDTVEVTSVFGTASADIVGQPVTSWRPASVITMKAPSASGVTNCLLVVIAPMGILLGLRRRKR